VPPGDATALARAIETLMADAALRERMGAAGRQRVRDLFTTEAMMSGLDAVYRETLDRCRRSPTLAG